MKCGIGICGRCNIGGRYVCVDEAGVYLEGIAGAAPGFRKHV